MEDIIREVDFIEASECRKFTKINWDEVSNKYCKELYNLLYRMLSNDGAHINLNAIQRFLSFDKSGALTGMRVGPDISDLVDVLSMACLMILWASGPFIRVFEKPEGEVHLRAFIQRFDALPHGEPADVRVAGNY